MMRFQVKLGKNEHKGIVYIYIISAGPNGPRVHQMYASTTDRPVGELWREAIDLIDLRTAITNGA